MTVRLVEIPGTALLVPGAAGRADVLPEARRAVLDALALALAPAGSSENGTDRVVVVAPGPRPRRGALRPDLAQAGLEPSRLGWAVPPSGADDGAGDPAGVAASVALLALAAAGWRGPVDVVEVVRGRPDEAAVPAGAVPPETSWSTTCAVPGTLVVGVDDAARHLAAQAGVDVRGEVLFSGPGPGGADYEVASASFPVVAA
ncbi:hypothetical protein [Cellulomonas sp. PhB143]|uniref:hypothetical protein n=1 Tax=Cellulomonas sp. PhB143 TaxID=2485186 RepID=UPI000F482570|nr:hypothetical protein [Cellulomonas sp. PhB143]ROS77179.1 hypothetical protein EDF32_1176 [Cellulomonas sp. PhB143]